MIGPPLYVDVGETYACSADANPPAHSYVWTRDPSGDVLSTTQTLTLTAALVIGQFNNTLLPPIDYFEVGIVPVNCSVYVYGPYC